MKVVFSDTHTFEREVFDRLKKNYQLEFEYLDFRLTAESAAAISDTDVVCSFVSDRLDTACLKILADRGVRLLALRSAGFNHVNVKAARDLGIQICRVPRYSPHAVAEFAVGLTLCLNRKIHRAYNRVHELNFSLDGLVGFDMNQKVVGIFGAGKIGQIYARILSAFGCEVLIHDIVLPKKLLQNPNIKFASREEIFKRADVISLHVPLNPETFHMINADSIQTMKPGVLIVNTGRGALIEAKALIEGLKTSHIGGAALDVYEEEEGIFFHDFSSSMLKDDILARLLTFPTVLVTSHQAFLTREALENIAGTTLENISRFRRGTPLESSNIVG